MDSKGAQCVFLYLLHIVTNNGLSALLVLCVNNIVVTISREMNKNRNCHNCLIHHSLGGWW